MKIARFSSNKKTLYLKIRNQWALISQSMDATTELQRYIACAYSKRKKKNADGTEACR
jgi:hypothetical protein